ncbi:hypothetical protein DFJ73DRAFT_771100 [Zopfochytrium polystomum]|nr:hypothetical protein DFJ73DRAFT_771100 [Zopfochytrium polystomum]
MAVFARLSLVVIVNTAICAGSLAGLALVESALVRTSSSSSMRRPPDSSSLFGTTAYLPLIDWRELGSRRVYERLGALGLSWVSYTALLSILAGSATHKTAILVVSPLLRVLGRLPRDRVVIKTVLAKIFEPKFTLHRPEPRT